jgi:hypothetical protein
MIWPVSETSKLKKLLLLHTSSCQLSPTGLIIRILFSWLFFQAAGPWGGVPLSPVAILAISPQTQ